MTNFQVTALHIKSGIPDSMVCCPITLALREYYPRAIVWQRSGGDYWCDLRENGVHVYKLPMICQEFARKFDAGDKSLVPFTFTI